MRTKIAKLISEWIRQVHDDGFMRHAAFVRQLRYSLIKHGRHRTKLIIWIGLHVTQGIKAFIGVDVRHVWVRADEPDVVIELFLGCTHDQSP